MTRPRWRRAGLVTLAVLGLAALTLARSAALRGYSNWIIDEHFIVLIAAGFIDFDLDPRWFNYHPLPMYLLGTLYYGMYLGARVLGLVASKPEFIALLYSHDAVFYVPAKLLGSFAYTLGCAVLGWIAWRRTARLGAALLAFVAPLLLADGIATATNVRTDTFVFLFLALTVWFACFAPKGPRSALLATVCCAAAFASKLPAIVLAPVLFAQLAFDARRGALKWRHVAWAALLFPVAVFLFMPYAFLDFEAYRPTLFRAGARLTGHLDKLGKTAISDPLARWANLFQALHRAAGFLPLLGSGLLLAFGAVRDRVLLLAGLFPLAYLTAFATSSLFDAYWLRPVYPFVLLFPILLACEVGDLPAVAAAWRRAAAAGGTRLARAADRVGPAAVLLVLLAVAYGANLSGNLPRLRAAVVPPPEDTRITATRWIDRNLPAGARIVLEGALPHYAPRVYSPDAMVTLRTLQYAYPFVARNRALAEGYGVYFARARRTRKPFRVVLMSQNEEVGYDMRRMQMLKGDYVVLTDRSYARYYTPEVMASHPDIAANAQAFFAFVRRQEPVRTFTGEGPTLEVWRMREGLPPPGAPAPAG